MSRQEFFKPCVLVYCCPSERCVDVRQWARARARARAPALELHLNCVFVCMSVCASMRVWRHLTGDHDGRDAGLGARVDVGAVVQQEAHTAQTRRRVEGVVQRAAPPRVSHVRVRACAERQPRDTWDRVGDAWRVCVCVSRLHASARDDMTQVIYTYFRFVFQCGEKNKRTSPEQRCQDPDVAVRACAHERRHAGVVLHVQVTSGGVQLPQDKLPP